MLHLLFVFMFYLVKNTFVKPSNLITLSYVMLFADALIYVKIACGACVECCVEALTGESGLLLLFGSSHVIISLNKHVKVVKFDFVCDYSQPQNHLSPSSPKICHNPSAAFTKPVCCSTRPVSNVL